MAEQRSFEGVSLSYYEHQIGIQVDSGLKAYLAQPGTKNARSLSEHILAEYGAIFGKPLHVSLPSMTVDILLHAHTDAIAQAIQGGTVPLPPRTAVRLKDAITSVRKRPANLDIEIGEVGTDQNRWIFDYLAPFCGIIEAVLES